MLFNKIIKVSGASNSGKTSILGEVYNELKTTYDFNVGKNVREQIIKSQESNIFDHRCLLKGKNKAGEEISIVITSPGDNQKEIINNLLFIMECLVKGAPSPIDFWLLSENTEHPMIVKLYEKIIDELRVGEKVLDYTIKATHYGNGDKRIDSDIEKHSNEILKELNVV